MGVLARLAHVNLIARDWRKLAAFYARVFGCVPVPPERELAGPWLDEATGLPGARLAGIHMRFPGQPADGPTLEIFQYEQSVEAPLPVTNRLGFGHIAVAVPDVAAARDAVAAAGGGGIGALVSVEIPGAGHIQFVYATDPEGNILELQHWSR